MLKKRFFVGRVGYTTPIGKIKAKTAEEAMAKATAKYGEFNIEIWQEREPRIRFTGTKLIIQKGKQPK